MPSSPMPPSYNPFTTLQAAGHDRAALACLAEQEQPGLAAWLERVLRDDDLAQEAVQETWLVLSRGDWSFAARTDDAAGDVRAWLRRIALRAALRLRERQRTHRRHLDGWFRSRVAPIPAPTPLDRLADQDRRDLVWAMVAELPATLREPVELRFRDGLDFAAIGRAQGCTALAARVRTWRGLAQMRRRLLMLGILVMPTSLMATLGGGAVGGITGGSVIIGVLPGMLARMGGAGGVLATGLVLAGGMVTSALCWWLLAADVADAEAMPPGPVSSTKSTAETAGPPPWELRRAVTDIGIPPMASQEQEQPTVPPGAERGQVLIDMWTIVPGAPALPFDANRPTVLTVEQRAQLISRLAARNDEVLTHPRLTLASGQRAHTAFINQHAYIAGYARIPVFGPDPVVGVITDGFHADIVALVESDGTRIVGAEAQRCDHRGSTRRTARVDGRNGGFLDLQWEEPAVHFSQAITVPPAGIFIPPGGALLLPANAGRIDHATPGGTDSTPDATFRPWWVLIVPSVVTELQTEPDSEPTLPGARG